MSANNDGPVDPLGSHPRSSNLLSAEVNEIVTFNDVDDPDLWLRPDLPHAPIEFVDHDPAWAENYSQLSKQILTRLGDKALGIAHVGSTSVPGLAAKPIIDVALVVADPRVEPDFRPLLNQIGFELVIRQPAWYQHRMFKNLDAHSGILVAPMCNLHVFGPRCPEVARMRLFRDWLTGSPDDRNRYQAVKLRSVAEANSAGETVMEYNARKQCVIREIYRSIFRAEGWI